MIPWSTLAWTQVHSGHLPLWNPYSALGTPLAFNWQSSAFSLPSVVGYLVPLRFAYTTQVMLTVFIAGSGAYVFGRVLRLSVVACTFAGVVFELSGPFFSWVGWPIASVLSWSGWIFAALVLVTRGEHRTSSVGFLAFAIALSVYAGQPDTLILLGLTSLIFFVVLLAMRCTEVERGGLTLQPILDVGVAGVAAIALSAPLLLPGLQLIAGSVRSQGGGALNGEQAMSVRILINMFVGFDGFSFSLVAAIGAIAVVLAVSAIVLRRRDPVVIALTVIGIVSIVLTTFPFVISLMTKLPLLHAVRWPRALTGVAFVTAMLGGIGMDRLVRATDVRSVRWVGAGLAVAFGAILVLFVAGPGVYALPSGLLSPLPAHFRSRTFLWEGFDAALGVLAVVGMVIWLRRPRSDDAERDRRRVIGQICGLTLLVCQTIFLVASGEYLWPSNRSLVAPTPAEAALQHAVGSSVVGLGSGACLLAPGLGVLPNVNVMFGIRQMAVYDPLLQTSYFSGWQAVTGKSGGEPQISTFCPSVTSATVAREFGIGYVLTAHGSTAPVGGKFAETLGSGRGAEDLYRIPGAVAATFTPSSRSGASQPSPSIGAPISVSYPDPASWRLATDEQRPGVLRLHLFAAPGWHATLDGKPLSLETFSGFMLQASIPAGRHTVVVRYLPETFVAGGVLALCGVSGLVAAIVVARIRRRPATEIRAGTGSPPESS